MAISSGKFGNVILLHKSDENPIKASDDNIQKIVDMEISRLSCLSESVNLNHIDVSEVTDMSGLFRRLDINVDVFLWDTHNVVDMSGMFEYSTFDGDISYWDVSNVEDMTDMFNHSKFKGDISHWDVSKVKKHDCCFDGSPLEKQPNKQPKFNP